MEDRPETDRSMPPPRDGGGVAPSAPPATGPMRPVHRRVQLIDILRGFAVFGILLVNQQLFHAPLFLPQTTIEWWPGALNEAVELLIIYLAQGKFITMFSFLFGLGLAIQMERAESRGARFVPFFSRRLFWLLVIGLVHSTFIWYGDILVIYALLGFLLMAFRKRADRTLVVWTIVLLLIPVVLIAGLVGLVALARTMPEAVEQMAESAAETERTVERLREVYTTGSFGEIFAARLEQRMTIYAYSFMFAPYVLAMFLIGLGVGRRRLLHDVTPYLATIRRALPWLGVAGIVSNTVVVGSFLMMENPQLPSGWSFVQQIGATFGWPTLSCFYMLSIALLLQNPSWARRLSPLAAVGRMALTNYLMHSLVFTTVSNNYGLGFYGRITPPVGLLLTLLMYAVQIPLSSWWLSRYRFGPVEWLWRSLTYGKLQPMR
jgi:uncharacterized protein